MQSSQQQAETLQQKQYVSAAEHAVALQRIAQLETAVAASSAQQQPIPSRSYSMAKPKEPDVFTGDSKSDVIDWTECLRTYLRLAHVADDDVMGHVRLFLKGSAALWWRKLLQDNPAAATWTFDQFAAALISRYSPAAVARIARDKINVLRQTASVSAYNDQFIKLSLRISDMTPSEAMDKYVRGLKPEIATWIAVMQPQDIQVAMNAAVEVDRRMWAQPAYRQKQQQQYQQVVPQNNTAAPMEIGGMRQQQQQRGMPYQNRYNNIKCFNCGMFGHKAAVCRQPKRNKLQQPTRKERRVAHQLNG